jgi:SAM-dependent methyltransferase
MASFPSTKKLSFSSRHAIVSSFNNKPIVFEFCAPHRWFRISEPIRVLLSCFPYDRPVTVGQVLRRFRTIGRGRAPGSKELCRLLARMIKLGVLTELPYSASSIYTPSVVESYARSRPIPLKICNTIVKDSLSVPGTTLFDIGSGAGSLALQISRNSSAKITSIDTSKPFLEIARRLAKGHRIRFINGDGNKLLFNEASYDVVVACQSFHWLDPAWAARGICHILRSKGIFFAIESKPLLSERHPLRKALGFGAYSHSSILEECARHAKWYSGLFAAMPVSGFRLLPVQTWIFRERRQFDVDFARSYFPGVAMRTRMPDTKKWSLEEALQKSSVQQLGGHFYWLLAKFSKMDSGKRVKPQPSFPNRVVEITLTQDD